ncbi:mannosyltransferase family protein [Actinopolymorpha sp. B9G3]
MSAPPSAAPELPPTFGVPPWEQHTPAPPSREQSSRGEQQFASGWEQPPLRGYATPVEEEPPRWTDPLGPPQGWGMTNPAVPDTRNGNTGRHADIAAWNSDQSWGAEPRTGIEEVSEPVTDPGLWYADAGSGLAGGGHSEVPSARPRMHDALDDPTTTSHAEWVDEQPRRTRSEGWTIDRHEHARAPGLDDSNRWGDDRSWNGRWGGPDAETTGHHLIDPPPGQMMEQSPHRRADGLRAEGHRSEGPRGEGLRGEGLPGKGLRGEAPTRTDPVPGRWADAPQDRSGERRRHGGDPPPGSRRVGAAPAGASAVGSRAESDGYAETRSRIMAWTRLTPIDLEVLQWWLLTRLGILIVVLSGPLLFLTEGEVPGFLDRWKQWDFWHFDRIAIHGYFAPGWDVPVEAFFPGLPTVLRLGHAVGLPTVMVGLLVSFVAGGVAAVALARLAEAEWGEGAGRRAAVMWMVAPPAIFLAAPYTEALFLGLAIPAWLAARRGHWWLAAVLAAGASTVRVSGLFLAIALAVEFLTSPKRREWVQGLWLALPLAPLLGYMAYLKVETGDWLRWYNAQADEWYRGFTPPNEALMNTMDAAGGKDVFGDVSEAVRANFEWMFRAEIVAILVGVVLTVVLLAIRRWGEATWVGIQVLAFMTSYWFFSVPRASLLWFPLWMGLAAISLRKQWVWLTYLLVAVPLLGMWTCVYVTGKWAG